MGNVFNLISVQSISLAEAVILVLFTIYCKLKYKLGFFNNIIFVYSCKFSKVDAFAIAVTQSIVFVVIILSYYDRYFLRTNYFDVSWHIIQVMTYIYGILILFLWAIYPNIYIYFRKKEHLKFRELFLLNVRGLGIVDRTIVMALYLIPFLIFLYK